MRHVLPLALLLFSTMAVASSLPTPVQLARRAGFLPTEHYQQQRSLWTDYVADHPQDAQAWRSLYLSAEYGRDAGPEQLDAILLQMSQAVPNSWELPYT